jgi:hypothetical protein
LGILALGIKHPLDMTVQPLHAPDTRIIVGPKRLHSISASIAVCYSGNADSFFGSLVT